MNGIFQFLNPKAVIASIIVVSTYINPGENFLNYTTQIIILALLEKANSSDFLILNTIIIYSLSIFTQ